MKAFIYSLDDLLKDTTLLLDYFLYLIFNPFKFKKLPKEIKKILVIELLQIGDLIVATPTIKALREKYKEAVIDVLILPEMQDVLTENEDINRLILYENNFKNLVNKIKRESYDLAVILHTGSFKISLALFISEVKYRIGCTKSGIFYGKGFFLNKKIKPNFKIQHKIEDNLDVIRPLGIEIKNKSQNIFIIKESEKKVKEFLNKNKIKKFVVIHPGANYRKRGGEKKEWILERYAELSDKIIENYSLSVIFTGGIQDRPLINNILRLMKNKAYDFSGNTIKDFFSIIKVSELVISVDTSASHIAAAFDKPVIVLFGSRYSNVWYPYTDKKRVISRNSMKEITINDVMKEISL